MIDTQRKNEYNVSMARSALVTAKQGFALLILLFTAVFGCTHRESPKLYIYCDETFWYVMQEEAIIFNKINGSRIILVPIRSPRTTKAEEGAVEIGNNGHTPLPWHSIPKDTATSQAASPSAFINHDIEQQIERIEKESFGDMFLSVSQKQREKLQYLALSVDEFPVCYLTLTMLVPKGNPHQFQSIKNVLESNRPLGIVNPSLDGLGESSWKVLGSIVTGGESAIPKEQVRIFERQYDLLEALEKGAVDAALVWDATSLANFLLVKYAGAYNADNEEIMDEAAREQDYAKLRIILQSMYEHLIETKSFAEEIPLVNNPGERCVMAVQLTALSTTSRYAYCERFADFMRSQQGKDVLRRFGFVPE